MLCVRCVNFVVQLRNKNYLKLYLSPLFKHKKLLLFVIKIEIVIKMYNLKLLCCVIYS